MRRSGIYTTFLGFILVFGVLLILQYNNVSVRRSSETRSASYLSSLFTHGTVDDPLYHTSTLNQSSHAPRVSTKIQQEGKSLRYSGSTLVYELVNNPLDKTDNMTKMEEIRSDELLDKIFDNSRVVKEHTVYVSSIDETIPVSDKRSSKSQQLDAIFNSRKVVNPANCRYIFNSNWTEITRVELLERRQEISTNDYIRDTKNCPEFIRNRGYITHSLSKQEEDFPIAFTILMYKDVEQSERLLRAIYRPQNIYCIHVDNKTRPDIYEAMKSITYCFDNVFMASKRYNVRWSTMTVLQPDLLCMRELWDKSKTWKYFINLTGQEFPLKTNYELVEILKAYNGTNDMNASRKRTIKGRWRGKGDPPHGIIPIKGSVHIVASRAFVEFVVTDQRAKDFLKWTKTVKFPDEVYFSSLQHNPHLGIPGAYKGSPGTRPNVTLDENILTNIEVVDLDIFRYMTSGSQSYLTNFCSKGGSRMTTQIDRMTISNSANHYRTSRFCSGHQGQFVLPVKVGVFTVYHHNPIPQGVSYILGPFYYVQRRKLLNVFEAQNPLEIIVGKEEYAWNYDTKQIHNRPIVSLQCKNLSKPYVTTCPIRTFELSDNLMGKQCGICRKDLFQRNIDLFFL